MKILLITDTWKGTINGVVTTLTNIEEQANKHGDTIEVFHPGRCRINFSMPFYKEIQIGLISKSKAKKILEQSKCDFVHIATMEGPLGITFARACYDLGISFATSCHTKFPEFVNARFPFIPVDWGWKLMKFLYRNSRVVLTTTESMEKELRNRGFKQDIKTWTRGVNRSIFNPYERTEIPYSRPLLVCVSRVSHEKGLDEFCRISYPGATLVIVGDGPYRKELEKKYPDVIFVGFKTGNELAQWFRNADVFVFPSRTDTFGVVMIESMACGTPVAAFPVTGPIDVVEQGVNGYVSDDLNRSIQLCLGLNRDQVYESSLKYNWEECYQQFRKTLISTNAQTR